MHEFLSFERFITQDILIIIYYLGVLIVPYFLWQHKTSFVKIISKNSNKTLISFFIIFFLFELLWRIIFEAMIGYFDMHNYLQIIMQSSK